MTAEPIRVACVDDHPVFRAGIRTLLSTTPELLLVGEASSVAESVELMASANPDVVLMDLRLPDGSGVDAAAAILADHPRVAVLMLTMHDDERAVSTALRAGARGYLLKHSPPEDVLRAILAVAAGQAVLGAGVSPERLAAVPGRGDRLTAHLTDRERQILDRVAAGDPSATIAAALHLSPKTVANTLSTLMAKLAARDRAHLVALARDAGLGATG
jgi:DNA-binding NarL/FixJ family response regulator